MRKLLSLGILAVAISISSQAIARSDKSIGSKCYQSYRNSAGGNQAAACIQNECQQKHKNHNINSQIQCQTAANKKLFDLTSKSKGK